ncbi:MAG: HEPN domain-containing protein [Victivallales bacterium]|nr:HEPN domain-containing protein [Victivallales bacterium]
MNKKEAIEYWVELAEYDLETAKVMLDGKRYLYVGFMCHQAVEKILKAHYVSVNNEIPPFTHNLMFLAEETDILDSLSDGQKDIIQTLRPLNVESRYPKYKDKVFGTLSDERCREIVSNTESMLKWIKTKL